MIKRKRLQDEALQRPLASSSPSYGNMFKKHYEVTFSSKLDVFKIYISCKIKTDFQFSFF